MGVHHGNVCQKVTYAISFVQLGTDRAMLSFSGHCLHWGTRDCYSNSVIRSQVEPSLQSVELHVVNLYASLTIQDKGSCSRLGRSQLWPEHKQCPLCSRCDTGTSTMSADNNPSFPIASFVARRSILCVPPVCNICFQIQSTAVVYLKKANFGC